MKKFINIIIGALAVLTLAGCSGTAGPDSAAVGAESAPLVNSEEITLTVWSPQEEQDGENSWLRAICSSFDEEHPEWDITWKYGVCDAETVSKNIAADPTAAADVYVFTSEQLGWLIDENLIAQFGGAPLKEIEANFNQTVKDTVTGSDGGIYGAPVCADTALLFYNKSSMSEKQVQQLADMLKSQPVAMALNEPFHIASFLMAEQDASFSIANQTVSADFTLGEKNGEPALRALMELSENHNALLDVDGLSAVQNGLAKAAFSRAKYANEFEQALQNDFGAAVLPEIEVSGNHKKLKSLIQTQAVGVNPNCRHPKAAVALAAYMSSPQSQKMLYEMCGKLPASETAISDSEADRNPLLKAHKLTLENNALAQPFGKEYWSYLNAENWLADLLLNKEITEETVGHTLNQLNYKAKK